MGGVLKREGGQKKDIRRGAKKKNAADYSACHSDYDPFWCAEGAVLCPMPHLGRYKAVVKNLGGLDKTKNYSVNFIIFSFI